MLLTFVMPPVYGKGFQPIEIKHITIGRVVQKASGEGQNITLLNTFGHITGFTRNNIDNSMMLLVKWDDTLDSVAESSKNLVLL